MAEHLIASKQAEMDYYRVIATEVENYLDTLAAPLQAATRPLVATMLEGEFSQVMALLSFWLNDLAPVPPEICRQLGLAHLYCWWYYFAQDQLLDGEAHPDVLLGGHLALLKMVEIYEELGLAGTSCWAELYRLIQISAEAHAQELQARFTDLAELTPTLGDFLTLDFISNRVAPFYFNTIAQLRLAGIPDDHHLQRDLLSALRGFACARQIGDDAGDWPTDLRAGYLNYVSARLIHRLYERGLAASGADLDMERLVGYQLADEPFWAEIEQTCQQLSRQALTCLAAYNDPGECRLTAVVRRQMENLAEQWNANRAYRTNLRQIFNIQA